MAYFLSISSQYIWSQMFYKHRKKFLIYIYIKLYVQDQDILMKSQILCVI